jgi:hypothetical protein
MRRPLVLVALLFLLSAPGAYAWTWPVQGPVLLGFAFDPNHPYAGGQHRGIDIGATTGRAVVSPAAGTVTFAGTVPTSGKSVTIATADGYSVTLTHLGSIGVAKGASVGEGGAVGTVGPTGTPELDVPYLYMGVRITAEAQGYLDPLSFLPALPPPVLPGPPPPPVADPPPPVQTTTAPDPAAVPPPAETTTTPEPDVSATTPAEALPPDPAPDATATPTSTDAPAPVDATSTPTSGAGDVTTPPDTSTDAPAPPPPADAGASDPLPVSEPPASTPIPPPAQALASQPPHATVVSPDPGLDPTAPPDAPTTSADVPAGVAPEPAAEPVPTATELDSPPTVAVLDDDALRLYPSPAFATVVAVVARPQPRARTLTGPHATSPHAVSAAPSTVRRRIRRTPVLVPAPRRHPVVPFAAPARPIVERTRHRHAAWPLYLLLAFTCAAGVKAVRMISSSSKKSEGAHPVAVAEDPGRGRMAVCERTAAPGPCRRPRRAVRHLRALSPAQGKRRPHGERDGRARHPGDGVGRSRGRVAS